MSFGPELAIVSVETEIDVEEAKRRFSGVACGTAPRVSIINTYSRDGRHISTVTKTEDGRVLFVEGPCPSKDVVFMNLPRFGGPPEPETEKHYDPKP